ncbi:MAG: lytic transglycosylase domain-containing protein [Clostridia bacterium]|nr:lytic transglycosylase domain-containing protein [Clostridia bacterium]
MKAKKIMKARIAILAILISIIFIAIVYVSRSLIIKITYPEEFKEYVEKYAKEENIEKELIYALIKAESNFNENAVSNKNALGLMQLLESTANEVAATEVSDSKSLTKEQILEPEINIMLGTKYISTLIQKYDNIELALAAYNAGGGNVDKWIRDGILSEDGSNIENVPYKETNNYVRKILRDYKIYKEIL